jgi:hypothetical protein
MAECSSGSEDGYRISFAAGLSGMLTRVRRPLAIISVLVLLAGCSSRPEPVDPLSALGAWTLAEPSSRGGAPKTSTLLVSESGFDRVTLVEEPGRTIEIGETGSWTRRGGALWLEPESVTVAVTEAGDVRFDSFSVSDEPGSEASLQLVGDRLVLELLEAGRSVGRYAYRRE